MSVYFWMYVMKYLGQLCHDLHNLFENGLAKEKKYTHIHTILFQIHTDKYQHIFKHIHI